LWSIRETISEAYFTKVKHDVSVPVSSIPRMIDEGLAELGKAFPDCVGAYIRSHR